jgi:anti-sigma regulatory factor (Ser/Thr protein kinase)
LVNDSSRGGPPAECPAEPDDGDPGHAAAWAVRHTLRVDATRAADVRRSVAEAARVIGMDESVADRFVVAVNEIVINAVRHGGGIADVTVSGDDHRLLVTIVDYGPGLDLDRPITLPPAEQTHGRGLWLAQKLCDDVAIDSSATGTRIRLSAAIDTLKPAD